MEPLHVAVAVDFSPEADRAVRLGFELARASGGELILLHAIERPDDLPIVSLRPELSRAIETRRSRAASAAERDRTRLAELCDQLSAQGGATVLHSVLDGRPDLVVPRAARELGADLLLVGTHGRTGLRWFFLGSVAERMIRSSEIDVLVARGDGPAPGGFRRILVATDFSPQADRALDRAMTLAAGDAVIDVVHFTGGHPAGELHDQLRSLGDHDPDEVLIADLAAAGETLVSAHVRPGRVPRFSVVRQRAIPGIVHRLEALPYDLVALGSHGRRGLERLVLGSVAETVARRAPCSVLITRGRDAPG